MNKSVEDMCEPVLDGGDIGTLEVTVPARLCSEPSNLLNMMLFAANKTQAATPAQRGLQEGAHALDQQCI